MFEYVSYIGLSDTFPETNIAPEKLPGPKKENHPLPTIHFSGAMLNPGGGYFFDQNPWEGADLKKWDMSQ